jgi:hypothetical protein
MGFEKETIATHESSGLLRIISCNKKELHRNRLQVSTGRSARTGEWFETERALGRPSGCNRNPTETARQEDDQEQSAEHGQHHSIDKPGQRQGGGISGAGAQHQALDITR